VESVTQIVIQLGSERLSPNSTMTLVVHQPLIFSAKKWHGRSADEATVIIFCMLSEEYFELLRQTLDGQGEKPNRCLRPGARNRILLGFSKI
jgi:hypothetical protein